MRRRKGEEKGEEKKQTSLLSSKQETYVLTPTKENH